MVDSYLLTSDMFHLKLELNTQYDIMERFKGRQVLTSIQAWESHCVRVSTILMCNSSSRPVHQSHLQHKSIILCCYWTVMPLCSLTLDMFIRYKPIHLQHCAIGLSLPRHSFPNTLAFDALPAPINFDNSAPV